MKFNFGIINSVWNMEINSVILVTKQVFFSDSGMSTLGALKVVLGWFLN